MAQGDPLLKVDGVSIAFGALKALNNLDMTVARGELVGLIGPNGAGKSTLFNVISSIYRPNQGDVFLMGKKITGIAPHKLCRMGITRTYQLVRTFNKMSAFENVLVGAAYGRKDGARDAAKRAMAAMELVEIEKKKDIPTSHLTLSDRRLVEIARALAASPALTLLDEPMAGLNTVEIRNLIKVIKRAREDRGISVLWVEHKVDAIFRTCDRVVVLDYGLKIGDGRPDEIAKDSKIIEAYLGESLTRN